MNGKTKGDDDSHEAPPGNENKPSGYSDRPGPEQGAASEASPKNRDRLEAENAELRDRLLRALADVENTRRRAERDLSDMRQYAIANFAGDMLNVADNLERAIATIPAHVRGGGHALKTLIDGVELTEKELLRSLERHGVKKLDPLGERFDPNFHEAMFAKPDPSVPAGTVTHVLQPGYAIGTRALRPAKVGVASQGPERPIGGSDVE